MAPVRQAMRFVNHQHGDSRGDLHQHVSAELVVSEALGRDEQYVDLVALQRTHALVPLGGVVRSDPDGSHSHPLGGEDLVAHQREKRRNEERWPEPLLAQELGGDEVNRALAPASLLNDEQSAATLYQVPDRLLLAVAEHCPLAARSQPEEFEGALRSVRQWRSEERLL